METSLIATYESNKSIAVLQKPCQKTKLYPLLPMNNWPLRHMEAMQSGSQTFVAASRAFFKTRSSTSLPQHAFRNTPSVSRVAFLLYTKSNLSKTEEEEELFSRHDKGRLEEEGVVS
jgi:hypothetical protein